MIHITNGRTDDIIGIFTQKDTTFNEHTQNLETYQDSFEFTSFGDHKYARTLTDMNRVIIPAEDGGYSEYVINTARKSRNRSNLVQVKTFASYQMLSVAKVIRPTSLSAYTPSQALGFITNDTEWRPGITESNATRTFHIENHTDRLSFLKTVANEFELEIRFRVETDGKRVTGRFIDLLERVGDWRGREITFGKDLDSIERTEEFGNIYTKLICLGPEDEDGNRLEIEVVDNDALQRWGRPHPITGELMHLEDTYEPTSERTDMTESELRQYGRTELNKRINSIITYEAEVVDLENVPGMANKKIRFGDTVRIKDEKFNPPLYVEARIFEQRRDIFTKSNKRVKLGDFIEYTEDELRAVIDRLSKIIQTKIGQAQLVEHTYSKVEIDDKDQYVFTEGKTFAEAVGVEAKDHADIVASDAESSAKQHAETEDTKVRDDAQGYADTAKSEAISAAEQDAQTKADSAQQSAQAYAEAKAEAERVLAESYADGIVSAEEQARIDQANANLAAAKSHAELKASEAEQAAKEYAELKAEDAETNAKIYADDVSAQALQQALAESVAKDTYDAKMQQIASDLGDKAGIAYVDGQLVSAIEGLEIGGRNLIVIGKLSSHTPYNTKWIYDESSNSIKSEVLDDGRFTLNVSGFRPSGVGEYTLSGYMFINSEPLREDMFLTRPRLNTYTNTVDHFIDDNTGRFVFYEDRTGRDIQWIIHSIYNLDLPIGTVIELKDLKFEKGNKATDWSPAPEDIFSEIDTKADGSTVYTISQVDNMINNTVSITQYTTDINGIVTDLSDQSTQIGQNTEAIGLKADQTSVDALSGTVNSHSAELLTMADEISAKVSADYVQTAIDDVEIGGRNYFSVAQWENTSPKPEANGVSYIELNLEPNQKYTVSTNIPRREPSFSLTEVFSFDSNTQPSSNSNGVAVDEPRTTETLEDGILRIGMRQYELSSGIWWINVEKGNKATDWSPAPEDVEAEISSLSAELSVQAGLISAKADSSTVTALGTRTTAAEQTIDAIEGEIASKVSLSDFNVLDGTVSDLSTTVSQQATQISARVTAEYVQTELETRLEKHSIYMTTSSDAIILLCRSDVQGTLNYVVGEIFGKRGASGNNPAGKIEIVLTNSNTHNRMSGYIEQSEIQQSESWSLVILDYKGDEYVALRKQGNQFTMWDGFMYFTGEASSTGELFKFINNETSTDIENIRVFESNRPVSTPITRVGAEVSNLSAELSVQAGLINAKANSSTVTAIGNRVSTAETKISAIEGEITSKVSTTDFNTLDGTVSTLSTTVSQQATQISARVTDAQARSIFTQEAGSFTFQANQINFDGHVFGGNATFTGKLLGAEIEQSGNYGKITLNDDGFIFRDNRNLPVISMALTQFDSHMNDDISLIFWGANNDGGGNFTAYPSLSLSSYGVDAMIQAENNLTIASEFIDFVGDSVRVNSNPVETIVSQGSNSSGHWIRYSSGVQICWNPLMSATGSTQASGAIYRSEPQTWNFPQPFSASPAVSGSVRAIGRWLSSGATSNTSATLIQYSSVSGTLYGMDMIAIGRWK